MRSRPGIYCLNLILLCLLGAGSLMAQPGATVKLVKPKKYENRTLASERPTDKPINPLARFNQDLNTVYNFHFNAELKLKEIINRAKMSNRDDFTKLLPFYGYTLDNTASQSRELDSVILKSNDAILLHDLRSDWVDDMYLLMGKAYFYRKTFDSAAITFQYINYAFQPRKKDEVGYDKFVGSNLNKEGNSYTISTREKKDVISQTLGHTPARNESIIWLLRTLVETDEFNEAASLIQTLRVDRNFPNRLYDELEELHAYWFYKNKIWDSTAVHLEKALDNASTPMERARWEYLLAQLHEKSGHPEAADKFYEKVITRTTDPVMEAWARINQIRLITGENEEERIKKDIAELDKMSRKSKYEDYKPIIFYAAAQLEMQRKSPEASMDYLFKSIKNNFNDPALKNKAFLQRGDIAFSLHKYADAHESYDSLDLGDPEIQYPDLIRDRNRILAKVVKFQEQINLEDSLQKIALMPEAERHAYVKNLSRKLSKEKGLKEEEASNSGMVVDRNVISNLDNAPTDLFASSKSKGDWYFYNSALKGQGFRQFQSAWGKRPNVDNWRRISTVKNQIATSQPRSSDVDSTVAVEAPNKRKNPDDITVTGLMANVPLKPEAMKASKDSVEHAYLGLGRLFKDKLGDCEETIKNFESLLNKFPESEFQEEALFALTYCYSKSGNAQKAAFYKEHLHSRFGQSKYLHYLDNPRVAQQEKETFKKNATRSYDEVYNLFIAGDFEKAMAQKKKADSSYGEQFWSPQLLYIESLYHIKQRQDSLAISTLTKIGTLYPDSKMTAKANTMIDVVKRRSEIESYLNQLQVDRKKEDSVAWIDDSQAPKAREEVVTETKPKPESVMILKPATTKVDSTKLKAPVMETKVAGYSFKATSPHLVMLLLDKVDIVYVSEARNALSRFNRERFMALNLGMGAVDLDASRKMVLVGTFPDVAAALEYYELAKSKATTDLFPWLPPDKYGFLIITPENLELLKSKKDMDNYRQFLKQSLPGKF